MTPADPCREMPLAPATAAKGAQEVAFWEVHKDFGLERKEILRLRRRFLFHLPECLAQYRKHRDILFRSHKRNRRAHGLQR